MADSSGHIVLPSKTPGNKPLLPECTTQTFFFQDLTASPGSSRSRKDLFGSQTSTMVLAYMPSHMLFPMPGKPFLLYLSDFYTSFKTQHPWYPPLILHLLFMASASAFFPPDSNCLFHLCEFPQLMSRGKSAWALHPLLGTANMRDAICLEVTPKWADKSSVSTAAQLFHRVFMNKNFQHCKNSSGDWEK